MRHELGRGVTDAAVAVKALRQTKALTAEDEAMIRDLFTLLAEKVFSWEGGGGVAYCRGTHHRATNAGAVRRIAAAWYADHPRARRWREYADQQWQDWWRYGEIGINDAGYFWSALSEQVLAMHVLDRNEGFTDPRVRPMWDHIVHEVGSDGAVIPYGAHGGWNSGAAARIMTLELVARHTRDGRYRWLAHRMFNYLVDTGGLEPMAYRHALIGPVGDIALASILADDSIEPVAPEPGSRLLYRHEIVRLSDAEAKAKYPDGLDCNMDMSDRVLPSKVMFRSGWEAGDRVSFAWLALPHPFPKDQYLFQRGGQQPYAVHKLVEGIHFLADTPELVAARVGGEEKREEWVILNAGGNTVSLKDDGLVKSLVTNARRLYLDTREGQTTRLWAQDALFLNVNGREVFRQTERRDVARAEK